MGKSGVVSNEYQPVCVCKRERYLGTWVVVLALLGFGVNFDLGIYKRTVTACHAKFVICLC